MPKEGHPPSYQRFPRDLLASISGESPDFRLRYAYALDCSWDSGSYGVGSPDEWLAWALLDSAPEAARASFLRALSRHTVTTPDGTLVQLRMAKDRCEQALRHSKNRENGALGTPARESRRTQRVPPGYPGGTPSDPLASASASASASESQKKKPAPLARRLRYTPENPKLITEADVEAAARLHGLPVEAVRLLAAKIAVATDKNGRPYVNHPQALLNWCAREPKPEARHKSTIWPDGVGE